MEKRPSHCFHRLVSSWICLMVSNRSLSSFKSNSFCLLPFLLSCAGDFSPLPPPEICSAPFPFSPKSNFSIFCLASSSLVLFSFSPPFASAAPSTKWPSLTPPTSAQECRRKVTNLPATSNRPYCANDDLLALNALLPPLCPLASLTFLLGGKPNFPLSSFSFVTDMPTVDRLECS